MTITKKRNASSFLNTFVDLFQVNLILFKGNPLSTESLWKSRILNVSVLQFDWLAGFIEEDAVNFAFTVQWSVQHSGTLIPSIQVSLELFAVTLRSCCTLSTPLYVLFISLKLLSWDLFSHLIWRFLYPLEYDSDQNLHVHLSPLGNCWFLQFFFLTCVSSRVPNFPYFLLTSFNGFSQCFLIIILPDLDVLRSCLPCRPVLIHCHSYLCFFWCFDCITSPFSWS